MIFSKKKSADTAPTESTEPQVSSPSRFEEHLPGAFSADEDAPVAHDGASVTRKPSVGIARDPVIRKIPSDRDEEASAEADQEDSAEDGADLNHNKSKSSHRRSQSVAITSDSGYDSTSNGNRNPKRSQSRASQRSMQAIPVVWTDSPRARNQRSLEDGDDEDEGEERRVRDSNFRRAASLRSFRSGPRGSNADLEDRGSIRTTPSMDAGRRSALRRRRASLSNGSFASGPGTVGPAASADLDGAFQTRSRSAELSLTEKQKLKLSKSQIKEGKKVAKIIKAEGKAEQRALEDALKELADLQKLQKNAVKEESKSYNAYSKILREFRKAELEFFAARAKYERAQADLQAHEDAREASRSHAREITEMLQEKNREVEWLRAQKAVDDREREAKVRQLTGKV
ncbi:hypothetical protein OH76DRAFT_1334815 [Lentinus brumalis]|uniref:Uncharacterized protein n=1 Tax=Lentinus brumalis TaxID=2498619 RepID=A0A371DXQ1_9APHY|nr:hypothetical protein OH76DRAFT_1334815 [Polyporus brumalis]